MSKVSRGTRVVSHWTIWVKLEGARGLLPLQEWTEIGNESMCSVGDGGRE